MTPCPSLPYRPQGTVYGTLLNFQREAALWATRMTEPPYQGAPQAPVLYIKTANTFSPHGTATPLPASVDEVDVGASIGLVIGFYKENKPLASVERAQAAINSIAVGVIGCVLMNDLSIPHASYYRPPVKYKNLDGFLGVGPHCVSLAELGGLAGVGSLQLQVRINGELRQTIDLRTLVRDAATLLADVNDFMTLQPGDVLMLGTDCLDDGTRPRARAGDRIDISASGFETLVNTLVKEVA